MVAVPGLTVQGYDGVLDEVGFASIIGRGAGLPHAVSAVGAWQVSAVANADRTVAVAVGTGFAVCGGVRATGSGSVTAQLPTITSGSRWDLVAALFDWTFSDATKNGTVTIEVVSGGSGAGLPGGLSTSLGSRFHMPLALVQVVAGRQTPAQIIDLRVRNKGGLATVASGAALSVYRAADPLEFDAIIDERGPDLPLLSTLQSDVAAASSVAAANSLARRDSAGALSVGVPTQGGHAARLTDLTTIGARTVGSPSRALLLAENRGNQAPSGGYIVGHFEQDSSTNQLSGGFSFVRGADGVQRVACNAAGVYFVHGEVTMSSQVAHTAEIRMSGTWGRAGTQIPSPAGGQARPTFSEVVLMPAGGVVSMTVSNNSTHQFISAALDITRIL